MSDGLGDCRISPHVPVRCSHNLNQEKYSDRTEYTSNCDMLKTRDFRHSAKMLCCGKADDDEPYWTEDGAKARSFLSPVRVAAFAQADIPTQRQAWELLQQEDSQ